MRESIFAHPPADTNRRPRGRLAHWPPRKNAVQAEAVRGELSHSAEMSCFSDEQLARISHLIREIEKLSDVEKLFLYLQLPCAKSDRPDRSDATDSAGSELGGRLDGLAGANGKHLHRSADLLLSAKKPDQETTQTYTWILSHLEVDPSVSLPKQEVYDEYRAFCQANRFEPLCVADFGKAMKHAFPCIKPRRLGQRGNSRYCYSGLRKKYKIQPPSLPELVESSAQFGLHPAPTSCAANYNQQLVADQPMLLRPPMNLKIEPDQLQQQQQHHHHHQHHSQQQHQQQHQQQQHLQQQHPHQHQLQHNLQQHQHQHQLQHNLQQQPQAPQQQPLTHLNHIQQTNGTRNPVTYERQPQVSLQAGQPTGAYVLQTSSLGAGEQPTVNNGNRYFYNVNIQPPGTPDDDDYIHHYQDALQVGSSVNLVGSQNFAGNSCVQAAPPVSAQNSMAVQPADSNFVYQRSPPGQMSNAKMASHSSSGSSVISSELSVVPISREQSQRASGTDQMHQRAPVFATNLNPASPATSTASNLSHLPSLSCGQMESCTSPFQSPASTPYHMLNGYWDMPDFYSTDCIQYPPA